LRFFLIHQEQYFFLIFTFFSSDYSHGFYLIWHLERKVFLVIFFWQLYTIQHYCSKIFKNSRKSFCALNLVKQTRPGEQDFGLFDIYFGCNTFLHDTKDFHFSQILDLKKIEIFFICKNFRMTSGIFRNIWFLPFSPLYFYILLQIENIIHLCILFMKN